MISHAIFSLLLLVSPLVAAEIGLPAGGFSERDQYELCADPALPRGQWNHVLIAKSPCLKRTSFPPFGSA